MFELLMSWDSESSDRWSWLNRCLGLFNADNAVYTCSCTVASLVYIQNKSLNFNSVFIVSRLFKYTQIDFLFVGWIWLSVLYFSCRIDQLEPPSVSITSCMLYKIVLYGYAKMNDDIHENIFGMYYPISWCSLRLVHRDRFTCCGFCFHAHESLVVLFVTLASILNIFLFILLFRSSLPLLSHGSRLSGKGTAPTIQLWCKCILWDRINLKISWQFYYELDHPAIPTSPFL